MKKIAFILALLLLTLAFVACGDSETSEPELDGDPVPVMRGDSALIFGANTAFALVYPSTDVAVSANVAGDIINIVSDAGLKRPTFSADKDKPETKCELLIGETSRALSAEAKAAITDAIAEDPGGDH